MIRSSFNDYGVPYWIMRQSAPSSHQTNQPLAPFPRHQNNNIGYVFDKKDKRVSKKGIRLSKNFDKKNKENDSFLKDSSQSAHQQFRRNQKSIQPQPKHYIYPLEEHRKKQYETYYQNIRTNNGYDMGSKKQIEKRQVHPLIYLDQMHRTQNNNKQRLTSQRSYSVKSLGNRGSLSLNQQMKNEWGQLKREKSSNLQLKGSIIDILNIPSMKNAQ